MLETVPITITQKDIPNNMKDRYLGIPVNFIRHLVERKLDVSPKYDVREAEDLSDEEKAETWYPHKVELRFKFQERFFNFFYIGFQDMLTSLGGVGALLNGIIENFGTLLIIIFFADLVYMMTKKHDYELIKFQRDRITKMLPDLIKAAESKIEGDQ